MKTSSNKTIFLIVVSVIISLVAYSQGTGQGTGQGPGPEPGKCKAINNIPGITEEQTNQINALQAPHLKLITEYRTQLDKLNAELRLLEIVDKPDITKIYAKIDEISSVKNKMAKEKSKHKQDVRALLTDNQKVYFDAHKGNGPHKLGYQQGNCNGPDNKQGFGPGKGQGNGACRSMK